MAPEGNDELPLPPGLREEYLRGVRLQVDALGREVDRLAAVPGDRAALDAMRREAHKIRGAAGSFGFPEASVVAAEIEEAAKRWLAGPGDAAAHHPRAARDLMRRLEAALFGARG